MKILLVVLVLLVPRPAAAQSSDALFNAGVVALLALDAVDAWSTYACVSEYPTQCHEANPVIRPFVDKHGVAVAMGGKLAVNAAILGVAALVRHKKPEWKKGIGLSLVSMGGVQVVVDVMNVRTLQTLRQGRR